MKYYTQILVLILFSVQINAISQEGKKQITLDDIHKSGKFYPERVATFNSMNDGETYCQLNGDSLNLYSYKSGKFKETIVTSSQLIPKSDSTPISMRQYKFSPNEKKILFATETDRIYRHSSVSNYYVYDIETNSLQELSSNGKQQLADFSMDASKVAFVRNNNIFIKDLIYGTETAITLDGKENEIINGAPDWVYEEEFSFSKGFHWSPDGNKIAYYRFDETEVKEFQMMMWGDLYPHSNNFKYPKAGEDNSVVSIHVYDLENQKTTTMDIGLEKNIYIPRISWTKEPDILSIQWMNRLQNQLKILLADASTGETELIYSEENKYYIDITDDLTFLDDREHFIITSELDGYNHIYLYDMLGNLEQQITKGEWDVNEFLGVDEPNQTVYYISSESSPVNRELYSIKLDGKDKKLLSDKVGNTRVDFSKNYKYYLCTFSDANTPSVVTVNTSKGTVLRTLTDNANLKDVLNKYNYSPKKFFTFFTSDNVELSGWMIKPSNFNPEKKYPVLLYVYGGPGSQTVLNSWGRGSSWYQMLVQQGLIIVSVDNRGTGSRGEEFKKMTYLQLGKFETIDQIEAAKYLGSLDYIDRERIGIWGWSYGGYMAASCLTKGADYFSVGIAVAPVTNWRYYDNIYTERFMRTPQENPSGYDDNSPINHVDKLKGKFLLVHGTADDNVHFQNSIDLVSSLVKANKQFDTQFYPNSNHGIYTGENTTYHLYSKLTEFIQENLLQKAD